jgi:Flp pilus assembly protein TadG
MSRAEGTFVVELEPRPAEDGAPAGIGRLSIDKRFSGDLAGTSRGEMMTAAGTAAGSAGYVAIERVTGALHGRTGEFLLQHYGTMRRGEGALTVEVVPDSATGELEGLVGTMTIDAAAGHAYVFEYDLPT